MHPDGLFVSVGYYGNWSYKQIYAICLVMDLNNLYNQTSLEAWIQDILNFYDI